jgi:hypothetical protein
MLLHNQASLVRLPQTMFHQFLTPLHILQIQAQSKVLRRTLSKVLGRGRSRMLSTVLSIVLSKVLSRVLSRGLSRVLSRMLITTQKKEKTVQNTF